MAQSKSSLCLTYQRKRLQMEEYEIKGGNRENRDGVSRKGTTELSG